MNKIIKTISLLTLMAVIPGAFAATTARPSYLGSKASPRLSVTRYINQLSTNSTTSSTWYDDVECVENYMSCIKGNDACGSDFEECTTNVLFHAQMPKCLSALHQCRPSGVGILFGVSSSDTNTAIAALSTVKTYNEHNEVTEYTYPTVGSDLGQMIIAAAEMNKLTKDQCSRKYMNCLKRDTVCGDLFELCTDAASFKKQAIMCDATLERCQADGKILLFGSVENANKLNPGGGDLAVAVADGASNAAATAVTTCQKVTESCFTNACAANPFHCIEGVSVKRISSADILSGKSYAEVTATSNISGSVATGVNDDFSLSTGSDVRKFFKSACLATVGSNKYCYMTFTGKLPKDKDLTDIEVQEDIFSLAYADRKDSLNPKLQDIAKEFDANAKNQCYETIKSCAMRSCGGGLGTMCYKKSRDNAQKNKNASNTGLIINLGDSYKEIVAGCAAVVNTDPNCVYAAASVSDTGTYNYTYNQQNAFDTLFPKYNGGSVTLRSDPIGAIAKLEGVLANSYNDAALEALEKQCRTVALGCVKSMCGSDYINCYRPRTDIISGTYNTDSDKFDRSMNKTGGVLDYNIVIGLCMNTVTTASVCEEHLKLASQEWVTKGTTWEYGITETESGTYGSVYEAWNGANATGVDNDAYKEVIIACQIPADEAAGKDNCNAYDTAEPLNGGCSGVMDEDGCIYSEPVYIGQSEYVLQNSAKSLFQKLLVTVEKEAQGKYKAKLQKEMNICLNNNEGGIKGMNDNGSTFQWVKLKSSKIPKDYVTKGLKTNKFTTSNDLYGSFCRARVTVTSDDKDIQEELANSGETIAYFAVGDSFTCGSWISSNTLKKITEKVQKQALVDAGIMGSDGKESAATKAKLAWGSVAGILGGGALGISLSETGVLTKALEKSNKNNNVSSKEQKAKNKCVSNAAKALNLITKDASSITKNDAQNLKGYIESAAKACQELKLTDCYQVGEITVKAEDDKNKYFDGVESSSIESMKGACEAYEASDDNSVTDSSKTAIRTAVPILTAAAGGALAGGITRTIIDTQKESIQNEAVKQWMAEIGDHIQCYVGGDELGSYGDTVSLSID